MKLRQARITLLVSQEETKIELHDQVAGITFAEIILTPRQLSQALSRLAYTHCDITLRGIENVGKLQETAPFEFEVPPNSSYHNNIDIVRDICKNICPVGWTPDLYFGSQNSFFKKGDEYMARCTIRRWVEIPEETQTL